MRNAPPSNKKRCGRPCPSKPSGSAVARQQNVRHPRFGGELARPAHNMLHSGTMTRIIASLLIIFITAMHIAWASDLHFAEASKGNAACVAGDECDGGDTHNAAADPDHCSHGSAHLVGILSGLPLPSLPESAAISETATIYFSVVSSPPTTPPKA